jgi:hypothetical protein
MTIITDVQVNMVCMVAGSVVRHIVSCLYNNSLCMSLYRILYDVMMTCRSITVSASTLMSGSTPISHWRAASENPINNIKTE